MEHQRIAAGLAAAGASPEAFRAALAHACVRTDHALLRGILAYRRHPYRRALPDPPTRWAEGGSRLVDYGPADAPVALFVPSLINRAQILDLDTDASLLRALAAGGVRPLLLDWGWPGAVERTFTLTDYIAGRLERALAAAVAIAAGPVVLVGYCMGGLLALAAGLRRPDHVRGLALLATPWDFHADAPAPPPGLAAWCEPLLAATGTLPVDALQTLFATRDPFGTAARYRAFAALDPASPAARRFVAVEDWANDGVPLAAPVAREALAGWYGANTPPALGWRVAGAVVDPAGLRCPAFLAIPARDRIVPPRGALALAERLPGATLHRAAGGHVGMVAGAGARAALWQPLLGWIRGLAPRGRLSGPPRPRKAPRPATQPTRDPPA